MLKIKEHLVFIYITILAIFGIVMIYSASNYFASVNIGDKFFFVKKQVYALILAVVAFFIAKNVNLEKFKKSTTYVYVLSLILLLLVFVPGIGVENYGAKRWLNLYFTTFQPSELAKFSLVMLSAKILEKKSSNTFKCIFQILGCGVLVIFLILLQPNMSIAITIMIVLLIMLFVGGSRLYQFLLLAIPIVCAFVALVLIEPYRLKRLSAFIDPFSSPINEGYQLIQSYYALAGGGLFGVGLFNSRQKFLFLPFSESDFILSIIGEELGLVGCIAVILIFVLLIFEGLKISIKAKDRYSTYLAFGITSVIAVQAILNIAVVSGSIPPTGLPLPFVSFGGSSLNVFFFFCGIIQNISINSQARYPLNKLY